MNDFNVEDNQAVLTDALRTRKHSWHFSIVAQGTPRWKVAGVARTDGGYSGLYTAGGTSSKKQNIQVT